MGNYQRYTGDFVKCTRQLLSQEQKQNFMTSAQAMDERMKQGIDSEICKHGAWYNASFNEVNGRILATREEFNPLLVYAGIGEGMGAMVLDSGGFYLGNGIRLDNRPILSIFNEALSTDDYLGKKVYERKVADFTKIKNHITPTDSFGDDDVLAFLAESRERVQEYGLWLKNNAGLGQVEVKMPYGRMIESRWWQKAMFYPSFVCNEKLLSGINNSRGFWLGPATHGSEFDCGNFAGAYLNMVGSIFGYTSDS